MPLMSETFSKLASAMIVAALLIAGLVLGKDLLIPITLAAVLTFILSPVVRRMTSWRLNRGAAVALVMLGLLGTVVGFAGAVSTQLISLAAGIEGYRTNILDKVRVVTGSGQSDLSRATAAVDSLANAIQREIATPKQAETTTYPNPGQASTSAPNTSAAAGSTIIVTRSADESGGFVSYLKQAGGPAGQAALTFLLTLFLLAQYQDLRDRVVRVVGTDHMTDTTAAMSEAGERLSQLFLTQALLNAGFGLVVGLALWAIGLPNAVLWGLVAAVMRFIPYIGSILAAVPPILLAAAIDPGWTLFFATAAVFVIGEPLMGHIVEPLVLGKRAGISPFAMVASAGFWTLVWGPVGLILAAPLTMTLIVLGRYVKNLEFFSVLLGDEPALSPPHELYHRLLSDDAISAAHHVDSLLATSSLAEVTDELIFPALSLAAQDLRIGRLDKEQVTELSESSVELLELLSEDRKVEKSELIDKHSAADFADRRILILPVRGAIDVIAARYLSHILKLAGAAKNVTISASSGLTGLADARALSETERPHAVILVTVSSMDPHQMRFIVKRAIRDFSKDRIAIIDFKNADVPQMSSLQTNSGDAAEGVAHSRSPSSVVSIARIAALDRQRDRATSLRSTSDAYAIPAE